MTAPVLVQVPSRNANQPPHSRRPEFAGAPSPFGESKIDSPFIVAGRSLSFGRKGFAWAICRLARKILRSDGMTDAVSLLMDCVAPRTSCAGTSAEFIKRDASSPSPCNNASSARVA